MGIRIQQFCDDSEYGSEANSRQKYGTSTTDLEHTDLAAEKPLQKRNNRNLI
jgi:hypothetical protein